MRAMGLAVLAGLGLALGGCSFSVLPGLEEGASQEVARLERAVAATPDHAHAWLLTGRNAMATGNPDEAARAFRRAAELMPELEEAAEGEGLAMVELGQWARAQRHFAAMADRFPDSPAPAEGLALVALLTGNPTEAQRHAEAAIRLDPASAPGHRYAGEAAYALGELAVALGHWRRAMELDSSQRPILAPMADDLEGFLRAYPPAP